MTPAMLVEEIMQTEVVTCPVDATIFDALQLMKKHNIRHLPIVNTDNELVGIIAERNLKDGLSPSFQELTDHRFFSQPVSQYMVTELITAHRLDFVEDLAAILYEHKIGCIPIVENQQVIGLVTETDMLYTLVQLTGAHQSSSIIEIHVENKAGILADIAQIISEENVNITSVLLYPNERSLDHLKRLVIRIQTIDPTIIIKKLENNGYTVAWPSFPEIAE